MGQRWDWAQCVDCGSRRHVRHKEWIKATPPRCTKCGGRIEPSDAAHDEHVGQHDAKRAARKTDCGVDIV